MAYSSYGSQINNFIDNINGLVDNINDLDLASVWQGKAYDKQSNNLKVSNTALTTQVNQLKSMISVLNEIDLYDSLVKNLDDYKLKLNSLDTNASNYASEYERLSNVVSSISTEVKNLKTSIVNSLNSVTDSYTKQFSKIPETELVNTADIFNDVGEYFSKIDSGFDINSMVVPFHSEIINDKNRMPNFDDTTAWLDKNPYAYRNVGQCTWFAWGRFYEIYGYSPGFNTHGKGCASQLLKAHGDKFYASDKPVAGAVFSTGLKEEYGHVGIVLEVDEANDKIVIQDGNYNGQSDTYAVAQKDWGTKTLSLSEFLNSRGGPLFANPIGEEAVLNG